MKDEGYDVEMDQIPMRPAAVLIKLNPDGTIEDALQIWITQFRLNAVFEDLRISAAEIGGFRIIFISRLHLGFDDCD